MSTQEIKQGSVDIFFKLLNGPYALPVIVVAIVYLWAHLSPDQIERVKELEPLMNSSVGIAFAVIIVFSYLSNVIASPIKDMTSAIIALETKLCDVVDTMEKRLENAENQHENIVNEVMHIKQFFEER